MQMDKLLLMLLLPRLYAIVDPAILPPAGNLFTFAQELFDGGCTWLQYRNKFGHARQMLEDARGLRHCLTHSNDTKNVALEWATGSRTNMQNGVRLIMNDRADLALA